MSKADDRMFEAGQRWLKRQFEFEFCEECSGDACHHTPIVFLGHWFARCDFPLNEETGEPHPIIVSYRERYNVQA